MSKKFGGCKCRPGKTFSKVLKLKSRIENFSCWVKINSGSISYRKGSKKMSEFLIPQWAITVKKQE
jgi:hypothetical protein